APNVARGGVQYNSCETDVVIGKLRSTKSEMKTDWWKKVEGAYHGVRDLRNEDRSRFLDDVCGSDTAMRQQIEALLQQDDNLISFLNRPAVDLLHEWQSLAGSLKVFTGTRVGAY